MARDLFHNIVKSALEKDGWLVTDAPLNIRCGGVDIQIDLVAEFLLAAEKSGEKIAVETRYKE
jgi:predicted RecB family endonuclease